MSVVNPDTWLECAPVVAAVGAVDMVGMEVVVTVEAAAIAVAAAMVEAAMVAVAVAAMVVVAAAMAAAAMAVVGTAVAVAAAAMEAHLPDTIPDTMTEPTATKTVEAEDVASVVAFLIEERRFV
eukprot:Rmarinus@m.14113